MPSEQATQVAKHIFDDLQGNGYYADPPPPFDFAMNTSMLVEQYAPMMCPRKS